MKIVKEVRHLLVCTDHEIHTCARSYAILGWISWKFMHFSWKDDSPLWILCVSWCQIERAARLRLRLGNLLHLHAIRDSKTWNDSDKTSMTAGNYKTSLMANDPWCYNLKKMSLFNFYDRYKMTLTPDNNYIKQRQFYYEKINEFYI